MVSWQVFVTFVRSVHTPQKDQIPHLKGSCAGIVTGALPGQLIQRFMVRSPFHSEKKELFAVKACLVAGCVSQASYTTSKWYAKPKAVIDPATIKMQKCLR